MWGDVGRCGEMWGRCGLTCSTKPLATTHSATLVVSVDVGLPHSRVGSRSAKAMEVGRYGEMRGDVGEITCRTAA